MSEFDSDSDEPPPLIKTNWPSTDENSSDDDSLYEKTPTPSSCPKVAQTWKDMMVKASLMKDYENFEDIVLNEDESIMNNHFETTSENENLDSETTVEWLNSETETESDDSETIFIEMETSSDESTMPASIHVPMSTAELEKQTRAMNHNFLPVPFVNDRNMSYSPISDISYLLEMNQDLNLPLPDYDDVETIDSDPEIHLFPQAVHFQDRETNSSIRINKPTPILVKPTNSILHRPLFGIKPFTINRNVTWSKNATDSTQDEKSVIDLTTEDDSLASGPKLLAIGFKDEDYYHRSDTRVIEQELKTKQANLEAGATLGCWTPAQHSKKPWARNLFNNRINLNYKLNNNKLKDRQAICETYNYLRNGILTRLGPDEATPVFLDSKIPKSTPSTPTPRTGQPFAYRTTDLLHAKLNDLVAYLVFDNEYRMYPEDLEKQPDFSPSHSHHSFESEQYLISHALDWDLIDKLSQEEVDAFDNEVNKVFACKQYVELAENGTRFVTGLMIPPEPAPTELTYDENGWPNDTSELNLTELYYKAMNVPFIYPI